MDFVELKTFIEKSMRMSHIYQPVMLMTLLEKSGKASVRDIATSILIHDESQIEYYEAITKEMVGRVLRKRHVAEKAGMDFELIDFNRLSSEQVTELIGLCRAKLKDFKDRRGARIWQHRKLSEGYISGTIRYDVLKRAKFRCELCGISAEMKALEVDHIVPRNKGGSDDPSNFQALCYSCNAMKRDRDDTDFRKVVESYQHREQGCIFCDVTPERIVLQNELCFVVADKFPVTPGHTLIIPKRHVADYFDLGQPELNAVHLLLEQLKRQLRESDPMVKGFNVGINCGETAGQTVLHCHIHLIPRREGDVENPAGGIRHLIPGKGNYSNNSHEDSARHEPPTKEKYGGPEEILPIADLWRSTDPAVWKRALDRYWQFVQPRNLELERAMERLDMERIRRLDAQSWYDFLRCEYFRWKYTAPNRYATTTRALQKYTSLPDGLSELHAIRDQLVQLDPSNVQAGLSIACQIRGLGTAGASGLLAVMYPAYFATVDQFVVKALRGVGRLPEDAELAQMNPESLTVANGVTLIGIIRRKAATNNKLFGEASWTPRKIDQILWTYGR